MNTKDFNNIDDYIKQFDGIKKEKLLEIRSIIKNVAPEATEKISYNMPTFYYNGNLVHFAAFKNHIGFYPAPSAIENIEEKLINYKHSKGAIQFKLNEELPVDLIKEIVLFRLNENKNK